MSTTAPHLPTAHYDEQEDQPQKVRFPSSKDHRDGNTSLNQSDEPDDTPEFDPSDSDVFHKSEGRQSFGEAANMKDFPKYHKRRQKGFWRTYAINLFWILAWYTFATCLSIYNKWMFSGEHYNFRFPLFVTATHMIVQFLFAALTMLALPKLKFKRRPSLRDYATKVFPCGLATGLDIGISNLSLKTITLSFYTMCKSSTLAFVLAFAFIFKLEKPRISLISVILIISMGVILMVSDETDFVFSGFAEVMTASVLGGVRWSLTQILLERESLGMNNPIASIFFLAPVMAACLLITSGLIEGYGNIFYNSFFLTPAEGLHTMAVIFIGGCMAFMMVVSEFFLISRTSVVTLSVCGIFKEVATIFISTIVFGDKLSVINIIGLVITLCGIGLYNWLKISQLRRRRNIDEDNIEQINQGFTAAKPRKSAMYRLVAESTLLLDDSIMNTYEEADEEAEEEEGDEDGMDSASIEGLDVMEMR